MEWHGCGREAMMGLDPASNPQRVTAEAQPGSGGFLLQGGLIQAGPCRTSGLSPTPSASDGHRGPSVSRLKLTASILRWYCPKRVSFHRLAEGTLAGLQVLRAPG
jgi:hypothetical protein